MKYIYILLENWWNLLETIRLEHASSSTKPICLVGDSFGGCLALVVVARNPKIDLVVTVSNLGGWVSRHATIVWHFLQIFNWWFCWYSLKLYNISSLLLLATSFGRSHLQPLLHILQDLPNGLQGTLPYFLSFVMGTSSFTL